eukprot:8614301-Alexandrium_andersonii.AAC.1
MGGDFMIDRGKYVQTQFGFYPATFSSTISSLTRCVTGASGNHVSARGFGMMVDGAPDKDIVIELKRDVAN